MADYDVIVVGAGNAALAASVSARNSGAERVLMLEKASEQMRGGTSLRAQLQFSDFIARRSSNPALSFRQHLRRIGGAIEE